MKFSELNLKPKLLSALEKMGYSEQTPIQEASHKLILEGYDIVGLAETGSGKTSACAIPITQMIDEESRDIQALVLVPTRELALQYVDEIDKISRDCDIECFAIFGGFDMKIQEAKLNSGVQVLVATPGRLIDFIYNSEAVSLKSVKHLILDEADEMLNMGFWEDIQFLLSCVVNPHQTLLFSATMPKQINKLINTFLKDPKTIELNKNIKAPQSIDHYFQTVNYKEKTKQLLQYLKNEKDIKQTIIFCNSRNGANELFLELKSSVKSVDFIHGGLDQNVRSSIFNRFKSGKVNTMIATDVAGRGLDFSKVTHVINYDMPREVENYTHRTGRAGRMGRKGTALTFITKKDNQTYQKLLKQNHIEANWVGKSSEPKEKKKPTATPTTVATPMPTSTRKRPTTKRLPNRSRNISED